MADVDAAAAAAAAAAGAQARPPSDYPSTPSPGPAEECVSCVPASFLYRLS